jgi:hypothetical protein
VLGQLIFAELPFACIGQPPYIERGWIKDCANSDEWAKQPIAINNWGVVAKNQGGWDKQAAAQTNWSVASKSNTDWDEKNRNDVNTIGCGYVPSNLGGKK